MDKKPLINGSCIPNSQNVVNGSTFTEIASYLGLDHRTVKKYTGMNRQEYEEFVLGKDHRQKLLAPYEKFVKEKL